MYLRRTWIPAVLHRLRYWRVNSRYLLRPDPVSYTHLDVYKRQVFTNPGCGDNAETHTVREWLSEFGIPVEDEFFKLWHQKIFQLGSIFRKAEKVCSDHTMELAWSATFVELYLEYDTSKDFLPQFEENSEKILNLMKMMPTSKDGVNHA